MNKFYVVLPSDSSMDVYPQNKVSHFKVNLTTMMNLDPDKWEVALQEIQFNHSWYNIRKGKNLITKYYNSVTPEETKKLFEMADVEYIHESKEYMSRVIPIPEGHYENVQDIIKLLQNQEDGDPRPTTYSYDDTTKRVTILNSTNCIIDLENTDIATCLGFSPRTYIVDKKVESFAISKLNMHDSVYVYTDIIENQNVGDYMVPLLRVVPVRSKFGELNWIHYDQPHYLNLSRGNITSIEINIKDELGNFISFEFGKAIVTLVFRKKTIQLFD